MSAYVPAGLRRQVRRRAGGRCEYCRLPGRIADRPLEFDHVRPLRHRGRTVLANLALACRACNGAKNASPSAFDPQTDALVPLFHPRHDLWAEHFGFVGAEIAGRTAVGRATAEFLRMNDPDPILLREVALFAGFAFP